MTKISFKDRFEALRAAVLGNQNKEADKESAQPVPASSDANASPADDPMTAIHAKIAEIQEAIFASAEMFNQLVNVQKTPPIIEPSEPVVDAYAAKIAQLEAQINALKALPIDSPVVSSSQNADKVYQPTKPAEEVFELDDDTKKRIEIMHYVQDVKKRQSLSN